MRLTSIEFSFDPCNFYCDGPRGVGYPADARSVGDSHPSCLRSLHINAFNCLLNDPSDWRALVCLGRPFQTRQFALQVSMRYSWWSMNGRYWLLFSSDVVLIYIYIADRRAVSPRHLYRAWRSATTIISLLHTHHCRINEINLPPGACLSVSRDVHLHGVQKSLFLTQHVFALSPVSTTRVDGPSQLGYSGNARNWTGQISS